MEIAALKQKILEKRAWLQSVADHCAGCASALSVRSRYLPSRQADRTLRSRLPMALAAG